MNQVYSASGGETVRSERSERSERCERKRERERDPGGN